MIAKIFELVQSVIFEGSVRFHHEEDASTHGEVIKSKFNKFREEKDWELADMLHETFEDESFEDDYQ